LTRQLSRLENLVLDQLLGIAMVPPADRTRLRTSRHMRRDCSKLTGRFEITSGRKLSIVCFRYMPARPLGAERIDALQQSIADELMRSGRAFLSTTRLNGQSTLRVCFVNWRTTAADVEEVVRLLTEIARTARRCLTPRRLLPNNPLHQPFSPPSS